MIPAASAIRVTDCTLSRSFSSHYLQFFLALLVHPAHEFAGPPASRDWKTGLGVFFFLTDIRAVANAGRRYVVN